MYQRSSTYIMTTRNGFDILFSGRSLSKIHLPLINMSSVSGLYCENGPPTDIADRLNASFPLLLGIGLGQRSTARIAELDRYVSLLLVFNATTICLEISWMHCTSAVLELIKESMALDWECWFGRKPAVII